MLSKCLSLCLSLPFLVSSTTCPCAFQVSFLVSFTTFPCVFHCLTLWVHCLSSCLSSARPCGFPHPAVHQHRRVDVHAHDPNDCRALEDTCMIAANHPPPPSICWRHLSSSGSTPRSKPRGRQQNSSARPEVRRTPPEMPTPLSTTFLRATLRASFVATVLTRVTPQSEVITAVVLDDSP